MVGIYQKGFVDYDEYGIDSKEIVKEGKDLSSDWQKIKDAMRDIGKEGHQYRPLDQNSNTAVDEALRRSGLPEPTNDNIGEDWAPGSGNNLPGGADDEADGIVSSAWKNLSKLIRANEFPDFSKPAQTISPIIIDLDGDGVETVSRAEGAYFDLDGNRFAERTGWVGAGDALLVLDRNGNGLIDDGGELFGSETLLASGEKADNGFGALIELDGNQDGRLDSRDEAWSNLKLWQDKDGDGISRADELKTLSESGLVSIDLQYAEQDKTDDAGNQHRQASQTQWQDGRSTDAVDVWFAVNRADSRNMDAKALSEDLLRLPTARGFGELPDLRQAMRDDETLRGLVEQYVTAETPEAAKAALLPLIYRWAGVEGIDPGSRDPGKGYGHVMDARQLVTLEKLVGEGYVGIWCWGERDANPHGVAAPLLKAEFDKFAGYVEAQLLAQTEFKSVMDKTSIRYDTERKKICMDWSAVNAFIVERAAQGELRQLDRFNEMLNHLGNYNRSFRDSYRESLTALMPSLSNEAKEVLQYKVLLGDGADDTLDGGGGDDRILGVGGNDVLNGGAGNDFLEGGDGDDVLNGGSGADTLRGGIGNDALLADWWEGGNVFEGGAGEDTMVGSHAKDAYVFNPGDGQDLITDNVRHYRHHADWDASFRDELVFGAGIGPEDVKAGRDGNDMLFQVGSGGDSVRVRDWFVDKAFWIERLIFADGTEWRAQSVTNQAQRPGDDDDAYAVVYGAAGTDVHGLAGDDTMTGNHLADSLHGDAGEDLLNGGDGGDSLFGGVGMDTLNGGDGDDLLDGGDDDDVLNAGSGTNTLRGGAGDDQLNNNRGGHHNTFEGGAGNDTLNGSVEKDRYLFSLGDGQDLIVDNCGDYRHHGDEDENFRDELVFGTGIRPDDVETVCDGNDMVFRVGGGDSVRVRDWFADKAFWIERVAFADGIEWDAKTLTERVSACTDGDDDYAATPGDVARDVHGLDGDDTLSGGGLADSLYGDAGQDVLSGGDGNDSLFGGAGKDTLTGGNGDDLLDGGDGDDVLNAGSGVNTLRGGAGDDELNNNWGGHHNSFEGGTGNDTVNGSVEMDRYLFNLGDGQDLIVDNCGDYRNHGDWDENFRDELVFGAGIGPEDVKASRDGNDMLFQLDSGGDSVRVRDWFADKAFWIERLIFADGSERDAQRLTDQVLRPGDGDDAYAVVSGAAGRDVYGQDGNDTLTGGRLADSLYGDVGLDLLHGGDGNDSLFGGAGKDTLNGDNGDDLLDGGDGDDVLNAGSGVNTLRGGAGDDELNNNWGGHHNTFEGGAGNDTANGSVEKDRYLFNLGDGQDLIVDNCGDYRSHGDWDENFRDELVFGAGIGSEDVRAGRDGDDMLFQVGNDGDSVRVKNWFADKAFWLERVRFADGSEWEAQSLTDQTQRPGDGDDAYAVVRGAAGRDVHGQNGNDTLNGNGLADSLHGDAGQDLLNGWDGDDSLFGGADEDTLNGGNGDDLLDGGDGDDVLNAGSGVNTLRGGAGDDELNNNWGGHHNTFEGGTGNDTINGSVEKDRYLFALGDGQDRIVDNCGDYRNHGDWDENFRDELLMEVDADRLFFRQSDDHLEISVIGTEDKVTVENWFLDKAYQIEWFKTSDGKTLMSSQVQSLVDAMAGFSPSSSASETMPAEFDAVQETIVSSSWQ
ncbi:calcium-binding protein [Chromobacterium sp. ATCC 53434]|uniref:calcium-binding protein n=1 Tax=Chromobacterium sp. (strain ATCC 53434 / SC 14030) TaxID=2059672 RepID=UPI0013050AAE|nr:calcium-binding protein [Chromobacterium sp. ATCC 53434]